MWTPALRPTTGASRQKAIAEDAAQGLDLCEQRRRRADGIGAGNGEPHKRGNGGGHCRETHENGTPAEGRRQGRQRGRRDHEAERAERHDRHAAERPALFGHIEDDRLETAHEAAGEAEADQGTRDRQREGVAPHREQQRAGRPDQQQDRLDAARPVAVEQHAERQLDQREREQIGRREEPEARSIELQFGDEIGGDHRVRRAEQIGKEVAQAERQEAQADDGDGRQRRGRRGRRAGGRSESHGSSVRTGRADHSRHEPWRNAGPSRAAGKDAAPAAGPDAASAAGPDAASAAGIAGITSRAIHLRDCPVAPDDPSNGPVQSAVECPS
jgi:hypothetical protein